MKNDIKKNWATFTPKALSDFVSNEIFKFYEKNWKKLDILDPACGDWSLLKSIWNNLEKNRGCHFDLTGYDINDEYLSNAKKELSNFNSFFENRNFIDSNFERKKFDIIIANPPYVRTQLIWKERSQHLSKKYWLDWKIDLAYAFVAEMVEHIKDWWIIWIILSNKFIYNKTWKTLRNIILKEFEVLNVVDFWDTKLFDASVLPCVLILRKWNSTCKPIFTKIYETEIHQTKTLTDRSIFDIAWDIDEYTTEWDNKYYLVQNWKLQTSKDTWLLVTKNDQKIIDLMHINSHKLIWDLADVKVGVKTTADSVFIMNKESAKKYNFEQPYTYDLIQNNDLKKYNIWESKSTILYPYNKDNTIIDLNNFKNLKKYFFSHKKRLSSRSYVIEAGRKWFEIRVPHKLKKFRKNKIVFPDISTEIKAGIDKKWRIVNWNCYWLPIEDRYIYFVLWILNSQIINWYYDVMFNNRLYAWRKRYMTQYIKKIPIPLNCVKFWEISDIAKDLTEKFDMKKYEELESKIRQAYGLSEGFIKTPSLLTNSNKALGRDLWHLKLVSAT